MTVRVGLNGFGRTGRAFLRAVALGAADVDVVAVNDLGPPEILADLLARDTVHGAFPAAVSLAGGELAVGDRMIRLISLPEVGDLPWNDLGVDVVVEATGRCTSKDAAARHLEGGAPRVVVSAPCRDADATIAMGVNEAAYDPSRHWVVSGASCTTNCLAPMAKVLDDAFGITEGFVTTVHAYTADQRLVDAVHKDPRRARAAGANIVPTTTGAAKAIGEVLPHLAGRLDGLALRVPVPDGSITDLVAVLAHGATAEQVREAFRQAAASGPLAGRLVASVAPFVSSDVVGSPASCVVDLPLVMSDGRVVKVLGWYDNEFGYACRLAELAAMVGAG
ncbi:MAG TPA: type I glyceraldehyde-3-phosphate dehydrogenase [Acidimicrobiales bacterium]|nr:type I glyceraldehyde-3-phosphate dehydrogenase [Acidimicrobiales bacterium]